MVLGPTIAALLVVRSAPAGRSPSTPPPGWSPRSCCCRSGSRAHRRAPTAGVVHDLRRGLDAVPQHHLALGRGARLRRAQRDPRRRLVHPRPGGRPGHHRHRRLGVRRSPPSPSGLLLATAVLLRVSFRFPLRAGMLGCLVFAAAAAAARPRPARRTRWSAAMLLAGAGHGGLRPRLEPRHAGARARGDAVARLLLRRARLVRRDPGRPAGLRPARRVVRHRAGAGGQRDRLCRRSACWCWPPRRCATWSGLAEPELSTTSAPSR